MHFQLLHAAKKIVSLLKIQFEKKLRYVCKETLFLTLDSKQNTIHLFGGRCNNSNYQIRDIKFSRNEDLHEVL